MLRFRVLAFLLFAGLAAAQPAIVTVLNAASLGTGIPSNSVAPGSLITVQIVRGGPIVINPDLSRVSLKLRPASGGAELDAPVLQGFASSYLALIPRETPLGPAEAVLTVEGQANLPATFTVVRSAPGIFARGRFGLGPALVQNDGPDTPPRLNQFTDPARPGDYLTLWITGLGDAAAADVTVEVAGIPVPSAYAGASPMFPGLDQINVALPAGLPGSCFLALRVRVGEAVSNVSNFAYSPGAGACKGPFGFSTAELKALDDGQSVRLGLVSMRNEVMPDVGSLLDPVYVRNEALFGEFTLRDAEDVALLAQPVTADDRYFGCTSSNSAAFARLIYSDDFDLGDVLHAAAAGKSIDAPHTIPVLYLKVIDPKPPQDPPFFDAGEWTVSAAGGRAVTAFSITQQLPPVLRWLNRESLGTVDRGSDLTVTWAADGYSSADVLTVLLSSSNTGAGSTANTVTCRAPASAGPSHCRRLCWVNWAPRRLRNCNCVSPHVPTAARNLPCLSRPAGKPVRCSSIFIPTPCD